MSVSTTNDAPVVENGHQTNAVAFTMDGEHLVSGGAWGVRVWRRRGGKEMVATMEARDVCCLAVSKDGRWIAAGTKWGLQLVWNAKTYKQVFRHDRLHREVISAVDFSPDSTRLVTASWNNIATIWNIGTRAPVRILHHEKWHVAAAKYSPQGDRIATATLKSVRVWGSENGCLLHELDVEVTTNYNSCLLWCNNHLFVLSKDEIKEFDASTGLAVSEWPISGNDSRSSIALPHHQEFIVHATPTTVTFWDISTHTPLSVFEHPKCIRSVTLSPDGNSLAIGGQEGAITVKDISRIMDTNHYSRPHPTLHEPEICVDNAALDLWKRDKVTEAEKILTEAITQSSDSSHVLACRALVRTRLEKWEAASIDAEESIKTNPSVMGYIAKFVALVGNGKINDAYRVCDITFEHFHSSHVTILLLIKAVVIFIAGERDDAILRINDLIATAPFNSTFYAIQAYMHLLLGSLHMKNNELELAIQSFKHAQAQLGDRKCRIPLVVLLISGWKFDDLAIKIQQGLCEALYESGRIQEAFKCLLSFPENDNDNNGSFSIWRIDLIQRRLSIPECSGDRSCKTSCDDDTPLCGIIPTPFSTPLLREWARLKLTNSSWKDALAASTGFTYPKFMIYRVICERLEEINHVTDAVTCFHQMNSELAQETEIEQGNWILAFKSRCCEKLEALGDNAMGSEHHDEAVSHYTAALSLNLAAPQRLFVKRSKARVERGVWDDALSDANEVIKLDSWSPLGYERKHAALHGAGCYDDAIDAFETMLLKISQSPDPEIYKGPRQYFEPAKIKATIDEVIKNIIRESPLVLINTYSGRLFDKSSQASLFESQPAFKELVSSMITDIDCERIKNEVAQYYRYATFSHKWEENEPLFDKVMGIAVYDLEESPTHEKLKMFCELARAAGLNWAWSDTCCINKENPLVLQEALVSMFKWYQGSSLTIVFLRGVHHISQRGALMSSIWNTRAWTLQEYHASKVVRFYTENWTPYMNLDASNHKESLEIISEMEEATGVSAQALMKLCPGSDYVREKLRLASTRQTTRIEDAAYSLFGIFSASLSIVYGEGDKALGRLLSQLLTSSGDASILAWTGSSGSFNSCLPTNIAVFQQSPTSHIPPTITGTKRDRFSLRVSSLNNTLTKLYDRLSELPVASFTGRRMKLPCLTFKLGRTLLEPRDGPEGVFHAQTTALGVVKIRTDEDISRLDTLYLIHPWIDFLLDRRPIGNVTEKISGENTSSEGHPPTMVDLPPSPQPTDPQSGATSRRSVFQLPWINLPRNAPSLYPPSTVSPLERQTRVFEFHDRLRQPFGALLLTPKRQNVEEYRRVAAGSLITVQVKDISTAILDNLIHGVRTLDVL